MATLNPNIILAGRSPNVMAGMAQGLQAGNMAREIQERNKLAQFLQANGEGIMSGDQNVLAQYAALDPQAAMAARQGNLNSRIGEYNLTSKQAADQRAAEAHNATMLANAKAAEVEETIRFLQPYANLYGANEREKFEVLLAQNPEAQAAGLTWENFPLVAAQTQQIWETVNAANAPKYIQMGDQLVDTNAQGGPSAVDVAGLNPSTDEAKPETDLGKIEADFRNNLITQDQRDQLVALEGNPQVDPADVDALRKEFIGQQAVKSFESQSTAFGRIVESANNPSPSGDLAMIFNFMKVLDPGSVVRESEFATAANAAAWLQEMESTGQTVPLPVARAIRSLTTGQRLSGEQRQDFLSRAEALYRGAERHFNSIYGQYEGIAERRGYPVEDSLIDYRYKGEIPQSGQPTGGVTVDIDGAQYTVEPVE